MASQITQSQEHVFLACYWQMSKVAPSGPIRMIAVRAPHSRSDPIGTALALEPQSHCCIRHNDQSRDHQKRSSSPFPCLVVLTLRACRRAAVLHSARNVAHCPRKIRATVLEHDGWKCHGISNQGRGCDVEWASCMGPCIDLNDFPTRPH